MAGRGEHHAWRRVGGANEVSHLPSRGRVAPWAVKRGPNRPQRMAALYASFEDWQPGAVGQFLEEGRPRFGSEFVEIESDPRRVALNLSPDFRGHRLVSVTFSLDGSQPSMKLEFHVPETGRVNTVTQLFDRAK